MLIFTQDRSKSQEWLLEHFPESFKMFENLSLNLSEQELLNRIIIGGVSLVGIKMEANVELCVTKANHLI